MKLESLDRFSKKKNSNIQFHKNPSSGSRVVTCEEKDRQTDGRTDGRTSGHDETNTVVAFRTSATAPRNITIWETQVRISGYKQGK